MYLLKEKIWESQCIFQYGSGNMINHKQLFHKHPFFKRILGWYWGKNGFVFSLDAFFALILTGIFLAVVSVFLSSSPSLSPALGNLATDEIFMLDSSGVLSMYITTEDNSTILDIFHTLLPSRYCYQLTIYDDDLDVAYQVAKLSCTLGNEPRGVGYQTVVFPDEYYLAKLEVWEP